jgi:uncharacterized lipoprotein YmbA
MIRGWRQASLTLCAILLGACGLLEPRSDPTKFVVLAAIDELPEAPPIESAKSDLSVGIGPIVLPDYLHRTEIVARDEGTRLLTSESERWGEPLPRGVERVLASDLATTLGPKRIVLHPWYATESPDVQIEIAFSRFEREGAGKIVVSARWSIEILGAETPRFESESRIVRTLAHHDGASTARGLSLALADVCREIAAAWPAATASARHRQ